VLPSAPFTRRDRGGVGRYVHRPGGADRGQPVDPSRPEGRSCHPLILRFRRLGLRGCGPQSSDCPYRSTTVIRVSSASRPVRLKVGRVVRGPSIAADRGGGNDLSRAESDKVWEQYAVNSYNRVFFEGVLAVFNGWSGVSKVDYGRADRAPLLVIVGRDRPCRSSRHREGARREVQEVRESGDRRVQGVPGSHAADRESGRLGSGRRLCPHLGGVTRGAISLRNLTDSLSRLGWRRGRQGLSRRYRGADEEPSLADAAAGGRRDSRRTGRPTRRRDRGTRSARRYRWS
jgi:hypothetical protein